MKRPYIPFLVFLILLLLVIPVSFDFLTSATPGWHTTILPPFFIWTVFVVLVLLFLVLGYWILSRRTDKLNWILFVLHLVLTISAILYLQFPTILLNVPITDTERLMKAIDFRLRLIPVAWAVFIVGQVIFLIYYIRIILSQRKSS